jgi:glutathione S-transferase
MLQLHHHPFSRAAGTLWALEEVGEPYELVYVDIMKGEQKSPAHLALNPMGKIPVLVDGATVITENAAISMYLADRFASGRLAPRIDDPRRGTYLRWTMFAPSVIEPAHMAKTNGWQYRASQAGWGEYEAMLKSVDVALAGRDYVLGETFSMADCVFGGALRFLTTMGGMPASDLVKAYVERITSRPAYQRSDAKNKAIVKERGLGG